MDFEHRRQVDNNNSNYESDVFDEVAIPRNEHARIANRKWEMVEIANIIKITVVWNLLLFNLYNPFLL